MSETSYAPTHKYYTHSIVHERNASNSTDYVLWQKSRKHIYKQVPENTCTEPSRITNYNIQ